MKALGHLCIASLCILLTSCGCGEKGSAKTKRMTLADFTAKLESLKTPHEAECTTCDGTGRVVDEDRGVRVACPTCKGTGKYKSQRGPSLDDWNQIIGQPDKQEDKPGDLIWEWWYYRVQEGTVRLPAFLNEEQGDVVRVVTGEPELMK